MKAKAQPIRTVLIAFPRIARTEKLSGIFRFLSGSNRWQMRLSDINDLDLTGVDGMIVTGMPPPAVLRKIERCSVPTVTIAISSRNRRGLARVETDGDAIVRAACDDLLLRQRYNSLVLLAGDLHTKFAEECLCAAQTIAQKHHFRFYSARNDLRRIFALPRPVAVIALNDSLAQNAILAGLSEGVRIPDELSVIGFGNERVFCESVKPSISSIEPDFEQQGFIAAKMLDDLMSGKADRSQAVVHVGLRAIIHRDSTPERKSGTNLVNRAMDFIRQKARDGIRVQDVIGEMHVSRRLLELRFRESAGMSILEAIVRQRLKDTADELIRSKDLIAAVCERCGWRSENYPKRIFKQQFKMSMAEYRTRHGRAN